MEQDNYQALFNANQTLLGLIALLHNMQDSPLEYIEPYQLACLLQPASTSLNNVVQSVK